MNNHRALVTLFVVLLLGMTTLQAQTPAADSIRKVIPTLNGEERTKAHKRLLNECMKSGDVEAVLQTLDEWRDFEARQKNVVNEADARWDKIIIFYNATLYDSIIATAPAQLTWFRQNKRWEDYYSIWRFLIFSYHYQTKVQTALRQAQQMLDDAQQRDNNLGRAWAYQLMGNIYSDIGQQDRAIKALQRSIELLADEKGESEYMDQAYNLYCQVLLKQESYDQASKACAAWKKNLDGRIAKAHGDEQQFDRSLLSYHQNYFAYLLAVNDLQAAEEELKSVERINERVGDEKEADMLTLHRAQLYMKCGEAAKALALTDSSEYYNYSLEAVAQLRAEALLELGRGNEAAHIYRDILRGNDSIYSRESRMQLDELNTLFHIDELEMKSQLERSRLIIGGGVLLLLVLMVFIYFRQRAAKRLEVAHGELQRAYDQLEETTAIKERIESELRIARGIQMSMVPSVFPNREGLDLYASMTPAREVGGDLYDYLLKDDHLYFCIGDVSGKGVPASLFMAQTTRLFRTLAAQQMMPADILTRMNSDLSADNEQSMFVTMFLGLVDLKTGHLDFCNAGHNPPVLGGDGQHGSFLQVEANAPIGLWPDLNYVGEELESIKGKPLFVYTDGLSEAENMAKEQFGDDRLLELLREINFERSSQVIERLQQEVQAYRDGAEPNDDLTMMCLKVM